MWRFWSTVATLAGLFLLLFFGSMLLGWNVEDTRGFMPAASVAAALLGLMLLSIDVVAPVPASLVMVANGVLFGVAAGTALSVLGGMIAFAIGFGIGRAGDERLTRLWGKDAFKAKRMLRERGALAIVASRPIPIVAETTAVLAGASPMTWRRASLAAAAGVFPQALLYALVGAAWITFAPSSVIFIAALLLGVMICIVASRFANTSSDVAQPATLDPQERIPG